MPFQHLSLTTMGLSNPINADDFAALLMDVEMKLDKTMTEARNTRIIGLAAGVRSALAGLISRSQSMAQVVEAMIGAQRRIDSDRSERTHLANDKHHEKENAGKIARLDSDIAAQSQVLAQHVAQYSTLQIAFMMAFGELSHLMNSQVGVTKLERLQDTMGALRLENINDMVSNQGKRQLAQASDAAELNEAHMDHLVRERIQMAVAVVVSAVGEVLSALAEIAPMADHQDDETSLSAASHLPIQG